MSAVPPYRLAHWGPAIGMVSAILYIVCFLWGFFLPPELQAQHLMPFRILFLDAGFVGLNIVTFVIGVVGVYIGGLLTGWILGLCLNHCRRWFP